MIYLDNAATTGVKPQSVINADIYALKQLSANPGRSGHDLSVKAAEEIYSCRTAVKSIVNASSEENVCFMYNCTQAVNTVLYGVLKPGDHIIISSLEHNAVLRPVVKIKNEIGVEYDVAEVDLSNNNITVENILKLIKSNTKIVFVTAASNVIGRRLPLKAIGELCRNRGIIFGVDGAQGVGIFDIDMQDMGIDFLCIAPHKGFYAPMGTGILVCEKRLDKVLIWGGTGVNSSDYFQPEDPPERYESGTVNLPGIAGIRAGINFVKQKGLDKIYNHEMSMIGYAYKKLQGISARLYSPFPETGEYAPVLSFNIGHKPSEEIGGLLNEKGIAVRAGLHCAPLAHKQIGTLGVGTVRISPSIYNSIEDVDKMIFYIKRLI